MAKPPPEAAKTVAHALEAVRACDLLGRETEVASFRELLDERHDAPRLIWVHGVGGIGKSSLLDRFTAEGRSSGWSVVRLDARDLRETLDPLLELRQTSAPRQMLMIDTCEELGAMEQDLFDRHLPHLPADIRMVFAGRNPPRGRWRHDPGWRRGLRLLALPPLERTIARKVLEKGGMSSKAIGPWLDFTRGHPLALSLAIEFHRQRPAARTDGDDEPDADYISSLLERFIDSLPTPEHRAALEVCALARATSESLLRSVLPDQAAELFAWLKQLNFVRTARDGLMPHDLVRELVIKDLRWRDPQTFRLRCHELSVYYAERMREASDVKIGIDFLYARRYAAFNEGVALPEPEPSLYADSLRDSDHAAIADLVGVTEGASSVAQVLAWMDRSPHAFTVFRGLSGVGGFMAILELQGADWALPAVDADLVLCQARRYVRDHAGEAERTGVMRWWIQRGALHQPGPAQNLVQARSVMNWATQTRLRWTYIPNTNAAFWHRHFSGIHFQSADAYACELHGLRFVPYVRDWRSHPFWPWVDRALHAQTDPLAAPAPGDVKLDASAFAESLRQALRNFGSDARLGSSPLRGLLADGSTDGLRNRLRSEAQALGQEPRGEVLRKVLDVTFFSGCPSQERAAERLDLPFGTFRHRLRAAESLLIQRLWLNASSSS